MELHMRFFWFVFLMPLFIFANGWSQLHQAIYDRDNQKINDIVAKSNLEQLEQPSFAGVAPLHIAVKLRDVKTVELLLAKGVDIDIQDGNGLTALHYAIGQNQIELARNLIIKGADMDLPNNEGITPLHQAAFRGDVNLIQFMLDNGASVDMLNKQGATPCQIASAKKNIGATNLLKAYSKLPCGEIR